MLEDAPRDAELLQSLLRGGRRLELGPAIKNTAQGGQLLSEEARKTLAWIDTNRPRFEHYGENAYTVQTSITITGDVATLRRVLDILAAEQSALAGDIEGWRREAIRRFVESLNDSCREIVCMIAASSTMGKPISRTQLIHGSSAPNAATDDRQINGLFGTIGRRWRDALPDRENPFTGRRIAPHPDEWFYALDRVLATMLQDELTADADRWRDGLAQTNQT